MGRSNASWIHGIQEDYELDEDTELEMELYAHEECKIHVIPIEDLVSGNYSFNGYSYEPTSKKKEKKRRDAIRGYPETKVERKIRKWHERWEKFPPLERRKHIAVWYLDDFLSPEERDHYCFMCNGSADKLVDLAYNACMEEIELISMHDPDPAKFNYLLEQNDFDDAGTTDWHARLMRHRIKLRPEIPDYLSDSYEKWLDKHPLKSFSDIHSARRKFLRKYLKKDRKEQDKLLYGGTKAKKRLHTPERKKAIEEGRLFRTVPDEEEMLETLKSVRKKTDDLAAAFDDEFTHHIGLEYLNEFELEQLRKTIRMAKEARDRCKKELDDCTMTLASHVARKAHRPTIEITNPLPPVTLCLDDGREITYDYDGNVISEVYNERGDLRKHQPKYRME